MYEQIVYEVADPIATIKLNRPAKLNAWTDRMGFEVRHAFAQAEADERVVVIVLTGEGRGFCAGADMGNLQSISAGERATSDPGELAARPGDPEMDPGFRANFTYLTSVRKPVIAAINGPCAGLAMPVALSADIRFASDRAVFTSAFPRRGLIAEWGISWLLPRVVGSGHALDIILSGRKVDASEAERMGLVNRVFPHDELLEQTYAYARDMALSCSPTSLQVSKRQVYEALQEPLTEAHDKAVRLMGDTFGSPDFAEGVQSFLERRPPRFPRVKG